MIHRRYVGLQKLLSDIIENESIGFSEIKIVKLKEGGSTAIIKKI